LEPSVTPPATPDIRGGRPPAVETGMLRSISKSKTEAQGNAVLPRTAGTPARIAPTPTRRLPHRPRLPYDPYMLAAVAIFAAGLFAWTFVEYAIHGWMAHVFRTFAAPLHDVHHRDPHAVFTIGAWIPAAAVWLLGLAVFGLVPAMLFYSGLLAGFAAYELIHYRIHFCAPANTIEENLRTRHLIHHYRAPDRCFGVSVPLWDRIFGTDLSDNVLARHADSVRAITPLEGRSNLRFLLHFRARSG
jgi:sterol desaturase/sphingolipid hydroxylase (fatty acid hydroxylase superfamily)